MKIIGLIGGTSWVSSMEYYKIINEQTNKRLGELHSAKCVMYSIDLGEVRRPGEERKWEEVTEIMVSAAKSLEKAGADFIVICANTMHKIADEIQSTIKIPILSVVDATAAEILRNDLKKVGLLGTMDTMSGDFYKNRLKDKFGIEAIAPIEKEMQTIHNVIFNELVFNKKKEASKEKFKAIIQSLVAKGAQGIILGCTEIPLLIKQEDVDILVFDTTMIHALAAVDFALS